LPPEICERIFDAVNDHDGSLPQALMARHTTRSCAIVCKAWRPHAQPWLVRTVILSTVEEMSTFALALKRKPYTLPINQSIYINQRLNSQDQNMVTLFPARLGPLLVNLRSLRIRVRSTLTPGQNDSRTGTVPHLPIHPRHPLSFHDFRHLANLDLTNIVFPFFSSFVHCLRSSPGLRTLTCNNLQWSCFDVHLPFWSEELHESKRLLPILENLVVSPTLPSRLATRSRLETDTWCRR
ncbi:hypothetical protein C8Q80DRAFT_1115515, partial [Daedaleopsis nitida]